MTEALFNLIKVLFDKTHNEMQKLDEEDKEGLSNFEGILAENGFEIEAETSAILESLPDAKVLWISVPTTNFTGPEMEAIRKFVSDGGGLLLTGEWGNLNGNAEVLNKISGNFGVKFNYDRVTDLAHAFTEEVKFMGEVLDKKKVPQFVKITQFAKHPIASKINEIIYFAGCSLQAHPNKRLAWSEPTSFSDVDADKRHDVSEAEGSFCVASSMKYGNGRVVCLGDASIAANDYIRHANNRDFCVNIFNWLAGKLPEAEEEKEKKKEEEKKEEERKPAKLEAPRKVKRKKKKRGKK